MKTVTLLQIREIINKYEELGLDINVPVYSIGNPSYILKNIEYKEEYKSFFSVFELIEEN